MPRRSQEDKLKDTAEAVSNTLDMVMGLSADDIERLLGAARGMESDEAFARRFGGLTLRELVIVQHFRARLEN
jgi:hypothetical protein